MVTGDVDAASNVLTIECMNINLKRDGVCNLISLNGQNRKFRMEQFMTRPGLEVKSLADFKGKVTKIASAPGPANLAMARAILTKVGLVEGKDYVLTELGMNLHADALRAGTFDAAYTLEPTGTMMANAGAGRLVEAGLISTYLLGRSDAESFMTGAAVTEKFMKERPDVARRFAIALRQANLDVMKDPSTRDLLKGNTFTSADITSTVPLLNFAMVDMIDAQDRKEFQQLIDFTVATKVLSGPIDVSKYLITLDKK
jgi:NitT/TauT family transport system substrate-binding protein